MLSNNQNNIHGKQIINEQIENGSHPDSGLTNKIRRIITACGVLLVLCCVVGAVWGLDLSVGNEKNPDLSLAAVPVISADSGAEKESAEENEEEFTGRSDESEESDEFSKEDILSLPLLADIASAQPQQSAAVPETSHAHTYVKIGLKYSSSAVASVSLHSDAGFSLVNVNGRSFSFASDLSTYTDLRVVNENNQAVVYDEGGNVVCASLAAGDCLMSAAQAFDSRIISIDGNQYRDGFMALPAGGKLTIINFVDMEHYLWGVINSEMTFNNPAEALKAQVVAARSFAVSHYNYHSNYGFDLCTTSNCQSYKGISNEKTQTTQACRDTAGIIMVSEGKAAGGYYFASSGGYTLNSEDVWGGKLSYLRSVRDEYAPLNFWNKSITFEQLQSRLSSGGKGVGAVRSVAVTGRMDNGAVSALTITGTDGSVVLRKTEITTVFGGSVLSSRFFSMGPDPEPGVDVEVIRTSEPYRYVSGEEVKKMVVLKGANRELTVDVLDNRYLITAEITVPVYSTGTWTSEYHKLTFKDEIVTGGTVYFTGLGSGHQVGFPQISAIAMAKTGKTYDEILTYYFTGISLQTLDTL